MTAAQEKQDLYFKRYAELEKHRAGEPSWLRDVRRAAIDRFGDLGFPTTHDEEWRFTNVAPIARTRFAAAKPAASRELATAVLAREAWLETCPTLLFVNGRFMTDLSPLSSLPKGIRVASLADDLSDQVTSAVERNLTRYASYQDHAFVALNTALFEDGALVEVKANAAVENPIALVFVTSPSAEPSATHPRNLIVVGPGAQASFIEIHIG